MSTTLIRESPSGPLVEVGGNDAPLSSQRWVDPLTLLDPSEQTGSDEAPFSTIQAAIDSIVTAAIPDASILLVDGDYTGQDGAWEVHAPNATLSFQGFGAVTNVGTLTVTGADPGNLVLDSVGTFTAAAFTVVSANSLSFIRSYDSIINGFNCPGAAVYFYNGQISFGGCIIGALEVFDSNLSSPITTSANLFAYNCLLDDAVTLTENEAVLTLDACRVTGTISMLGEATAARFSSCSLSASVSLGLSTLTVIGSNCQGPVDVQDLVASSSSFTTIDSNSTLRLADCRVTTIDSTGASLIAADSTITNGITCGSATLKDCSVTGAVVVTTLDSVDGYFTDGNSDVTASATARIQGGLFGAETLVAPTIECFDVEFDGTEIGSPTSDILIKDCRLICSIEADALVIDTGSYYQALTSNSAITATSITFSDVATGTANGYLQQLSTTNGDFPVGTTNWTTAAQVPPGMLFRAICIPSGPSGGSGSVCAVATAGSGGTGAGGVARAEKWLSRAEIIAALPIAIIVPAATTGALGVTSAINANGIDGSPGAACSFGSLLCAYPGAAGGQGFFGGSNAGRGGGGQQSAGIQGSAGQPAPPQAASSLSGIGAGGANAGTNTGIIGAGAQDGGASSAGSSSTSTTQNSGNSLNGGGAGGSGGGHTASAGGTGLNAGNGGASGSRTDGVTTGSGGAGGIGNSGTNGANGIDATVIGRVGSSGGGGSGNGTTGGTGGKGGNGGIPGGAGAGGGAAETDGVTPGTSGAGGNGARGEFVLECYA